ncbi:hypothetical protein H6G76_24525 [Nostoc sp. FACHB-152]|uniref:hypothetical protein n=1 Tax=Nostoc sp. FACHB-152 TaxID=2692837 RepID=UPI0016893422|nr:hypothetical protein [Nostoc sp. FACHB-152]MBD2450268.1 hypothetical protein [Nostoc sp. FACHB-152]
MKEQLQIEPPSQTLISPLLELRDYYAGLAQEYEKLYHQARSQLTNVESLLSSWSSQSEANNRLLTVEVMNGMLSGSKEDLLLSPSDEGNLPESDKLETNDSASAATDTKEFPLNDNNSLNNVDIPMIGEYASLTRMDAIIKLLQEHLGSVCHIDFIVRSLYGELPPHVFKVVKGRVQSSLTQGKERQAWFGIKNEPGCYTLDLSLVNANNSNGRSKSTNAKKKPPVVQPQTEVVPMLKPYEGLFLIDALTAFFRQNPGKVFSVAEVISGIYGKLDAEEIKEVKSKVLNELSRGFRTGRFSRMPNQVGLYTLDFKLI